MPLFKGGKGVVGNTNKTRKINRGQMINDCDIHVFLYHEILNRTS